MLISNMNSFVKRSIDLVGAVVLLTVLSIFFVFCATAVIASSRGPVFYRATRVGHGGREFRQLKFRKMKDGANGPALTGEFDPRFTSIGRFLAVTKLDELPQLINVLRGEMSLVGPRPEDPRFVAKYRREFERVLSVKPGITGLSQLAFTREPAVLDQGDPLHREERYVEQLLPQKIALDTLYAGNCSLRTDLRILAWTFIAVVVRREVAVNRSTGGLGIRRRPTEVTVRQEAGTYRAST